VAAEPDGGGGTRLPAPWSAVLGRAALLPVLVTLPLLGLAFRADERFNVYRFGAEYGRRPQGLVVDQLADVPRFLRNGNFRPVGRLVERIQELIAFQTADALSVAPHITMRAFSYLALAVLAVTLVVVVQTVGSPAPLRTTTPVRATALVAPLLAVGLVAAGNQSAVVLFTNLYVHAALLVLGVALLAARRAHFAAGRPGALRTAGAVGVGAVCASFNEVAYLAVPTVILLVAVRGIVAFGLTWRALLTTQAARLTLAFGLGFAAVFVPVRILIVRLCAEVTCYVQSSIDLSPDATGLLVQRITSWFPPPAWSVATSSADGRWYLTSNLVLAVIAVAAAVTAARSIGLRAELEPTPRAVATGLLVLGIALTVLPGIIGAISEGRLADWRAGSIRAGAGWRDTPLLLAGSALALTGLVELVVDRLPPAGRAPLRWIATGALCTGLVLTTLANDTFATRDAHRVESNLHHRIAAAVVSLDRTAEGDARRCALLAEFEDLHPTRSQHQERLRLGLDEVARDAADRPWCEAAP
jgi:hypothetical protein